MSLADQLTVLLVGFDLTFAIEVPRGEVKVVPVHAPVKISRRYPVALRAIADELKQLFPNLNLRVGGNEVTVEAEVEVHEQIAKLLRREREPERPTPVITKTRKLYTLRIEQQPIRNVLQQLGQRLGWTIETDDSAISTAGLSLDERVTFAVEKVDEDELLRALLRPAGLDYKRDRNRVRVIPLAKSHR
jgi:hypothetical protein